MILIVSATFAADLWAEPAKNAGLDKNVWEVGIRGAWEASVVPPFRVAARDRLSVGVDGRVRLGRVGLAISGEWLRDATGAGEVTSGFGDVRLGTTLRIVSTGPISWGLGWEAKMPNAADTGELGTDETDVLFGLNALGRFGPIGVAFGGGLAVLGNPLRFANQDDVPMLRLGVAGEWRNFTVSGLGRWDIGTARNPDRAEAELALRFGPRWFVEVGGTAGCTPAAADWSGRLALGWREALPGPALRE